MTDHAPTPRRWSLGTAPWAGIETTTPRSRVIIDNDFSGDPDDFFQLVHHLLSPTVEIPLVVASHLRPDDPMDPSDRTAENAEALANTVCDLMGLEHDGLVARGSNTALTDRSTPRSAPAVERIIAEAMREDTDLPLYYAAGGGLTDLASAYLIEPRIARRLTLLWIGGSEHPGTVDAPPRIEDAPEYNLRIDVTAAQVLFDAEDLPIWQFTRDIYRQCLISDSELRLRVRTAGPVGRFLHDAVTDVRARMAEHGVPVGETYAIGDQPLVLATALTSQFQPDTSSSFHEVRPCPSISDDGAYIHRPDGRPIRVYRQVDTRLMFEDMYAKLAELAAWQRA
ncbi:MULTISPECIES: nucleoside hydrolase [unclassified Actinomyces]|uniref:nucleoside hydrolase n=1 Tax=unclassified Actinomyces TaxID=2609248 RepID=UPI0020174FFC|nr:MULTISPECIES: nucleoside hydrolase [unclassified Actinomyces]MCL3777327.1 nucleoside hydrolase [Actinomyces sp. AC-20-1]MCL3789649.1 nucleoside hydrolase [Actinomyces sp. 187325]MCL3792186.1 nucleoside hydrolase [Actinomyces sp. 186855]MCL3794818.1 nucleoside hydrolase [Actinomyces sp. 217892]